MNSTSIPPERPSNPTHFGGEGLYEQPGSQKAEPLKVPLSDQLEQTSKEAIEAVNPTSQSLLNRLRHSPIPIAIAVGGLACLLVSLARRSVRN